MINIYKVYDILEDPSRKLFQLDFACNLTECSLSYQQTHFSLIIMGIIHFLNSPM